MLFLTTLRRLQGRPDPLEVSIEGGSDVELTWPPIHSFNVALRLTAGEEEPVAFMDGGDYRTGRQERFRIEVRDSSGKTLPVRGSLGSFAGGLCSFGALKPGDAWKTVLDLGSYVSISAPGTYRVRIQYHDRRCISHLDDISRFILCQSRELTLKVKPPVIQVSAKDREEVRAWIQAIDSRGPVKVLAASYGREHHDFIAPESAAGKILSAGWKAVPDLIGELDKKDLEPNRRAWIFSLLFTITRVNDPRERKALGPYSYREGTWAVYGGLSKAEVRGLGFGGEGNGGGRIREDAQAELTAAWRDVLRNLVVEEEK